MRALAWAVSLGAGLASAQAPRIFVGPESPRAELALWVSAPEGMNARELGAWQILTTTWSLGTREFTGRQLRDYGAQAGLPPRIAATDRLVCVRLSAPKGGEGVLARIAQSLLMAPDLSEARVSEARRRLSLPATDDFSALLKGQRGDLGIPAEFVARFAHRALRPERTAIAVSAGGERALAGRFVDWRPPRIPADVRVAPFGRFPGPERAAVKEFWGVPFVPSTSSAPRLLAAVALGSGVTGMLYEVWRAEKGWSYRQELILWPTPTGWQPRMILGGVGPLPDREAALTALLERAKLWDEADLRLAKAKSVGFVLDPLWPTPMGSHSDELAWSGFLGLIGAPQVSLGALRAEMQRVNLDDMRRGAQELLGTP